MAESSKCTWYGRAGHEYCNSGLSLSEIAERRREERANQDTNSAPNDGMADQNPEKREQNIGSTAVEQVA